MQKNDLSRLVADLNELGISDEMFRERVTAAASMSENDAVVLSYIRKNRPERCSITEMTTSLSKKLSSNVKTTSAIRSRISRSLKSLVKAGFIQEAQNLQKGVAGLRTLYSPVSSSSR